MKPSEPTPEVSPFTHAELLKALYWAWDAFDRATMGCFLVYTTAEMVLKKRMLEGNGVYVGTRRLEWESGSKSIFDSFAGEPNEKNEKYVTYIVDGVPVFIYIFEDEQCIRSTDSVIYESEYFKLPNPYSEFIQLYPWKSQ